MLEVKLFGETLVVEVTNISFGKYIEGYCGCYYVYIDLTTGEVYGERHGLVEVWDSMDSLMFRDGENYKEEVTLQDLKERFDSAEVDFSKFVSDGDLAEHIENGYPNGLPAFETDVGQISLEELKCLLLN